MKCKPYILLAIITLCTTTKVTARQLNVLFVVAYFPAPSQTYILNMMTGLIDRGHKVSIFAVRKKNLEAHPNVEKYSLMDFVVYEQLPDELPDYDIVFCQSGSLGKMIIENSGLAEWIQHRKVVVCLRGADITSNVNNDPDIYKELIEKADLFLPVCEYFKRRLISIECPENKIIIHHSAIDCEQFCFKERKKKRKMPLQFVSVGRLIQKKGIHIALKAIAKVNKKYKNIHYIIIGSGHYQPVLERLAIELGIDSKITFPGWVSQERVAAILDKCHIFLLPSITSDKGDEEGIPNALKEAMAMGLISIGTYHAGIPELINDGKNGFLISERNAKELAKKIKYIIKHQEEWSSIGLTARKKIENEFETKKSVQELERIFYELLADSGGFL
jgi:colanic acid/amylovoran biosynthesis glycosyltransferase